MQGGAMSKPRTPRPTKPLKIRLEAKPSRTGMQLVDDAVVRFFAPQPIVRLEAIRICASLAIVGFVLTHGALHAADWLSVEAFQPPRFARDWQPIDMPDLSPGQAWVVAIALVTCGLATAAGAFTRFTAGAFAVLLGYVALADRASTFTVSKISPFIALALCLTPSGSRWSVDAWWRRRRDPAYVPPEQVTGGCVRFFQLFLPVFYMSSGYAKASGEWLTYPYVLWTHLHDSYQTPVSWLLANLLPAFAWTLLQGMTLLFELFAPVWFALRWTRPYATAWALAMHAMIGLMFGPVIWFSLLMMSLVAGSYLPERWLRRVLR
jgi:uncharacterized membrane protein YphA (DoxX/SURF4 family)